MNLKLLSLISQFGINMLVPIFLCFFLGMWIDKALGTEYWVIILFFVGAIAGFRNVYIFAGRKGRKKEASSYEELRGEIRDSHSKKSTQKSDEESE